MFLLSIEYGLLIPLQNQSFKNSYEDTTSTKNQDFEKGRIIDTSQTPPSIEAQPFSLSKEKSSANHNRVSSRTEKKKVRVQLIVSAEFAKAEFTLNSQPVYPKKETPLFKLFEIPFQPSEAVLIAIAGEKKCSTNILIPSNYFFNPNTLNVICK